MMDGSKLLTVLLMASEKAANIARACRQNDALFKILVQEKLGEEKSPRFIQDFKTLADVLIQETIKHDIGLEFPELAKMVQGEENNMFSNTLGESITVKVCSNCEETAKLLAKVMDGNDTAAKLLAAEVHRDVQITDVPSVMDIPTDINIATDDLGLWIDPIDSTADYISGIEMVDEATGLHISGLRCVTVLIGAYIRSTGLPVLGVVNQPFYNNSGSRWKGICYWGVMDNEVGRSSIDSDRTSDKVIVLSRAEDSTLKTKLSEGGFDLIEVAGAGYKILSVGLGQAAAYILSKSSTFRWDTCGPHAVLCSLGGKVIEYKQFLTSPDADDLELEYRPNDSELANSNGLIAYRDPQVLQVLKTILCE